MKTVRVVRDTDGRHKFKAVFPEGRTVHFGAKGYSDYTIHKDATRMKRYVIRHGGRSAPGARGTRSRRENWGRTGMYTPGFWSRWLLWSRPTLSGAVAKTQRVLGRRIIFGAPSK
jgi:hypothetical protein